MQFGSEIDKRAMHNELQNKEHFIGGTKDVRQDSLPKSGR